MPLGQRFTQPQAIGHARYCADVLICSPYRYAAPHDLSALVLDLRGNPGGLLEAAVDIASDLVRCSMPHPPILTLPHAINDDNDHMTQSL